MLGMVRDPVDTVLATEDPEMAWWYFVRHHSDVSVDQRDSKITDAGILYPRGSALGGSAAVNAMVTVLPSPWEWDRLAALTQEGRPQRHHLVKRRTDGIDVGPAVPFRAAANLLRRHVSR